MAGYYTREQCHLDLLRLCSSAKVRFIRAEANQLDVEKKKIFCSDGRPPISYDVTSIDIGITPKLPQNKESSSKSFPSVTPVKPIDGFCARWDRILERVLLNNSTSPIRIMVVGGGAGGVELTFAIHHRLHSELRAAGRADTARQLQISIINRGSSLMASHNRLD